MLLSEKKVWKHGGKLLVQGTFAVDKPDGAPTDLVGQTEKRVISDSAAVPTNMLLDPVKIPKPVFAYVQRLRSLKTKKNTLVLKSKRDGRKDGAILPPSRHIILIKGSVLQNKIRSRDVIKGSAF